MRLAGAACVLLAGLLGRRAAVGRMRRETETLEDVAAGVRLMAEEIRAVSPPLPGLLRRAAEERCPEAAAFFLAAAGALEEQIRPGEAWRRAVSALALPEAERRAALAAADFLSGDREAVCRGLDLTAGRLETCLESRRERRVDEERRATAVSLCAAAMAVILLM